MAPHPSKTTIFPDIDDEIERITNDPRMKSLANSTDTEKSGKISREAMKAIIDNLADHGIPLKEEQTNPHSPTHHDTPEATMIAMAASGKIDKGHPLVKTAEKRTRMDDASISGNAMTSTKQVIETLDKTNAKVGLPLVDRIHYAALRKSDNEHAMSARFAHFSNVLHETGKPGGDKFAEAAFTCHDIGRHRASQNTRDTQARPAPNTGIKRVGTKRNEEER